MFFVDVFIIVSLFALASNGDNGDKKLVLIFSKDASLVIHISNIENIPIIPSKLEDIINRNLQNLILLMKSAS